jgi:hypothetical protein
MARGEYEPGHVTLVREEQRRARQEKAKQMDRAGFAAGRGKRRI